MTDTPINVDSILAASQYSTYLAELSRDNAQLLFTSIFQLDSKLVPDGVLAVLPRPTTLLPRSKPLPEQQEPTTWEKFAKIKGIPKKSRKPQLVWDETHSEYRRRFGYKRANNAEEQWLIPSKDNHGAPTDENAVDPFTKIQQDKKMKADKQAEKEQKNKSLAKLDKARSQATAGSKLKDGILFDLIDIVDITRTFALVSRSTASLGRFDRRLPGEKEAPAVKGTRKLTALPSAVGDTKNERQSALALADKMIAKEDQVNKDRAASQFNYNEMQQTRKRNRDELLKKDKKKSKK